MYDSVSVNARLMSLLVSESLIASGRNIEVTITSVCGDLARCVDICEEFLRLTRREW